jgi:cytochrome oxidase Cu insertion factor (SCO1/SenC/PrrC family)
MRLRLLLLPLGLVIASFVQAAAERTDIPDVEVVDQNGHPLHFRTDLLQGNAVAVNFVFTTCSTICPQLGAASAALARTVATQADRHLRVISISVDPEVDTPEQLKQWAANFGDAPGWTLVTGQRRDIDQLLRAFEVYVPDKTLHTSAFLIGRSGAGAWQRVTGTTAPAKIAASLEALQPISMRPASAASGAASRYFPDVTLLDQDGKSVRFYSDLVRGRVVVINSMFADCGAACPIMAERMAKVQDALGNRLGRDVFLLSISVDPTNDTPAKLHAYAERVGAKPGWEFLTGDRASVDTVLEKLGQYAESREAHSNLIIIGNEPTGLWKKAFGLAPADEIVRIAQSVAADGR